MRGIVTDINKQKAVILCDDGSFKKVNNRNYKIGQQVTLKSNFVLKAGLIAACFLVLFISGLSGYRLYYTPESYIYIDINPSLRIDINCFDRVISVIPLNNDGEKLIASHQVQTGNAVLCIENIISCCSADGYLNKENNDISIGVLTNHKNLSGQIYSLKDKYEKNNYITKVFEVSSEENNAAIELNISVEKLKAVEAYTDTFGGTISNNAKKNKETSNDEIYREIDDTKKGSVSAENTGEQPNPNNSSDTSVTNSEKTNKQNQSYDSKSTEKKKDDTKVNSEKSDNKQNGSNIKKDNPDNKQNDSNVKKANPDKSDNNSGNGNSEPKEKAEKSDNKNTEKKKDDIKANSEKSGNSKNDNHNDNKVKKEPPGKEKNKK